MTKVRRLERELLRLAREVATDPIFNDHCAACPCPRCVLLRGFESYDLARVQARLARNQGWLHRTVALAAD